jgi:hypothetical protein
MSSRGKGDPLAQRFNGSFETSQLRRCEEMPRRGSFIWPPVTLDTPEAKAGRYMAN